MYALKNVPESVGLRIEHLPGSEFKPQHWENINKNIGSLCIKTSKDYKTSMWNSKVSIFFIVQESIKRGQQDDSAV